jgi:nucleotide-binding universal stress UspA family protein
MSKTLKTIVIGTSLTSHSDAVIRTGISLARATGASPWLIHTYPPSLGTYGAAGLDASWIEEQVKVLREQIDAQVERTGLSTLAGFSRDQVRLVLGTPHREIVDLARRVDAGLIVVGAAEGHQGILGSTADRVIRKAPCPVLVVRSEAAFPPARVEIPLDLSPVSVNALRQGMAFLAQMGVPHNGTEVLFVLSPYEVGGSIHFDAEQIRRFADEELHRLVAGSLPADLRPQSLRVQTGYPREEILARLAERKADLAVLGTHGRGGFERLMIGSVTAGVLRGASCNLLVVPPEVGQPQDAATEERTKEPVSA